MFSCRVNYSVSSKRDIFMYSFHQVWIVKTTVKWTDFRSQCSVLYLLQYYLIHLKAVITARKCGHGIIPCNIFFIFFSVPAFDKLCVLHILIPSLGIKVTWFNKRLSMFFKRFNGCVCLHCTYILYWQSKTAKSGFTIKEQTAKRYHNKDKKKRTQFVFTFTSQSSGGHHPNCMNFCTGTQWQLNIIPLFGM